MDKKPRKLMEPRGKKRVSRVGNSACVILEQWFLAHVGWDIGTNVTVRPYGKGLLVERADNAGK